ncbi:30S ribosomal protein S2 [Candidatus Uhrbacteria bacterium CG10_big_fil_rev_8_21_14_0_10_50_16]|uniref:Small ribosomal subunit protein uS2 n=1 Tax=Candidatus Uhrbacteria bacterium CG10_big_fil_rev_8_21_14_0_10_50_16 TaxID=1975039 RepID=A0A2H0RM67_9BACT|nr:MAG: 30S ribosomal protein S2 [Candidatus Uhrbacteria bacterium CG10_big_fil_rev_8_21_14_0_10_50_16]
MSTKLPTMEELLQAGAHFGHLASRWHPKMGEFIFGKRQGVHIIDLEKTLEQLEKVTGYVEQLVANNGNILFLGTKAQTKGYVREAADRCGMPYVTERWLGGTLTNFVEISKLIKRYHMLKRMFETGEMQKKYSKREQLTFEREIADLEIRIGGLKTLDKEPDAIAVFDVRSEMTAIKEANRKGIPVVAICDTNVNPLVVQHVIPANDDAIKSIEMMTDLIAAAVLEGKKNRIVPQKAAPVIAKAAIK